MKSQVILSKKFWKNKKFFVIKILKKILRKKNKKDRPARAKISNLSKPKSRPWDGFTVC